MRRAALPILLLSLASGSVAARRSLESEADRIGRVRDPAWLPSGKLLRIVSFGHRLAFADLYWLRTVQYVGEMLLAGNRGLEALYALSDLTTDLDPRFGYAYQISASNLSGIADRVAESDRLLEKGMRNVPDRWALPFLYGFNKFFYENDYAAAAFHVRRAAEVGKRPHLALLAANLSLVADSEGEYAAASSFLDDAIEQAVDPALREQLEKRRVKVRTYQVLSHVEKALASFERRTGRRPMTLFELLSQGFLSELPRDPSGGEIEYDFVTGTVRSSVVGPRRPLRSAPGLAP